MNLTAHDAHFGVWMMLIAALSVPILDVSPGSAQVTTAITSSGLNTTVTHSGTFYDIAGGTRPGSGPNLFHSFGEFSVGVPDTARFLNATPDVFTSNILGRVTGGNPSSIFGTIDALSYPGANLFLMNPAGIIFGPNATLNVGGMVTFTTADYLRLADEALFNATPNPGVDVLLTAASVAAFGFLGYSPGGITVQGSQLSVPAGHGISLVGGNITVESGTLTNGTVQPARLSAAGGKINLASVASPGEIMAETLNQDSNINGQSFGALGTIQVSQQSVIDASGDGGGTVVIRGGRFVLDDSRISANTTAPTEGPLVGQPGAGIDIQVAQDVVIQNLAVLETNVAENVAEGIGSGGVLVKADRIEILGVPDFETFPFTGIRSNVAPESTGGRSGDIKLDANSILIKDLGELQTITEGAGDAGHIILRTNENLEIDGGTILSSSEFASGNAGDIELTSNQGNIFMTNFPFVTSQAFNSSGNAGAITVTAGGGDILLADFGSLFTAIRGTGGTGGSGQIQLTANNLQLRNRSVISGDNITPLVPGNITITLSGSLSLRGGPFGPSIIQTSARRTAAAADLNITAKDVLITEDSSLSTESRSTASGPGGNLNIVAERVQVTNGGQIGSGASGSGDGGKVNLQVGDLFVTAGGSLTATSTSTGNAGTITVQGLASPAESVVIDGAGSGISTETRGTGTGGNINVFAQSLTMQNGATVSAATSGSATTATGGTILVNAIVQDGHITPTAAQSVTLSNGASISASSTGPADAGSIVINAGQNFTSTNSSVTTQAAQASGGNITVLATNMVQLTNSQLSASVLGGAGGGGNITIDPTFVILQNSQILAQALLGAGGNISITTNLFLPDANSIVDASSQFGVNGNVTIQSPISQAGGKIVPLSNMPLETTALLGQRCAALAAGGQFSSFVMTGRDVLPTEPGGWLASPLSAVTAGASPSAQGEGDTLTPALSPGEREQIVSVRQLPPPGAAMQIFPLDVAGCGS